MRQRSEIPQTILGVFCVIAINLAICGIGFLIATRTYPSSLFVMGALSIAGISIVQLVYVLPAIFWLRRRQQFALMKGVIIGAVATALVNGSCYLLLALPR